MSQLGRAICVTFLILIGCQSKSKKDQPGQVSEKKVTSSEFLGVPKQLTFVGSRSGEGYFSADGRQMIFQSEREDGNPFYQIYLMNLETGQTRRLSNGAGKTTCAWIHPNGHQALFSSTHLDPNWKIKAKQEIETKKSGGRPKYSWSYDEYFDLYNVNLDNGKLQAIQPAKGYDAEGSYSPDGEWIAFASNRHAYKDKLDEKSAQRLDEDPAYFMEIYLMRSNGSDLKRLTNVAGYDGGPFFSPNGKKLTWRRFSEDGKTAEVWTMNVDGSEQKQITHLGAMSWAPFFHPSGDYLVFATNVLGYDNFEVYMIDSEGAHPPVRVTYRQGFDGLPVFTPDGHALTWTSRNEKGESQILSANWDDERARVALGLREGSDRPAWGVPAVTESDLREWVRYLSSTKMKGRFPGTEEEKIYSQEIMAAFARAQLKAIESSSMIQDFRFVSGVKLGPKSRFDLKGVEGIVSRIEHDWVPASFSPSVQVNESPVTFVGFGIRAPATEKWVAFDSYQGANVKGSWVVVLPDLPSELSNEQRYHLNLYSRLQHKALIAKQNGAVGLIVISEQDKVPLKYEGGQGEAGLPILRVSKAMGEKLLAATGLNSLEMMSRLNRGGVVNQQLKGITLAAQTDLVLEHRQALNVIGFIPVKGAQETLMLGAHGDHLGVNEQGEVFTGADDNASGVATLIELATYFSHQVAKGELKPKYNLAFAVWSGEEMGVLGSSHFIKNYKGPKIKAYLNMDMVGRLKDQLLIQGVGSAEEWTSRIEKLAASVSVPVSLQSDPYLPTDALPFYLAGTPVISFFTGAHAEYHTPKDRYELLNLPGMVKVSEVVKKVTEDLATNKEPLAFKKVEGVKSTEGRGFRLYLGTIPDYSQEGVKGVKISGTTKASPAENAGLKQGDVIVELGGIKIDNIQDYVYCLQSIKANQKTPVKVMRDGRTVELEIVPVLKGAG